MNPDLQCLVPGCFTRANQGIRFYPFPIFNLEICSIWESRVRGAAAIEIDPLTAQICELHFDYRCKTGKDCSLEENSLPTINLPEFDVQSIDNLHFHTSTKDIEEPDFEITKDAISHYCRFCFRTGFLYQIEESTYGSTSFLFLIKLPPDMIPVSPPSPNACLECLKYVMISNWLSRAMQHSNAILESLWHSNYDKVVLNRQRIKSFDIKSELASCNLVPAYPIWTRSDVIKSEVLEEHNEYTDRTGKSHEIEFIFSTNSDNESGIVKKEDIDSSPTIFYHSALKVDIDGLFEDDEQSVSSVMMEDIDNYDQFIISDDAESSCETVEELDIISDQTLQCEVFHCKKCDKKFHSRDHLVRHNSLVHADDFICEICWQLNTSKKKLEDHYATVHQHFKCKNCSKVLKISSFRAHMRTHGRRSRTLCKLCGKMYIGQHHCPTKITDRFDCTHCSFTTKYSICLQRHLDLHQPDEIAMQFICKNCGRGFRRQRALMMHSKQHMELEKSIKCGHCAKQFKTKYEYRQHKEINCGISPFPITLDNTHWNEEDGVFVCPRCDWKDPSRHNFMVHYNNHGVQKSLAVENNIDSEEIESDTIPKRNKDGKLQCSMCPMTFLYMSKLTDHMKKHTGERPYKCKVCRNTFQRASHLKSHVQNVHADRKPFQCTACEKSFKTFRTLTFHIHSVHSGKQFQCDYCDKTYQSPNARYYHQRIVHKKQ